MRKEFNYDNWDSHRDMILRSYILDDNLLTWNQMGVFGKTSLGNESVYNLGFALTSYISQKYGEDKLRELTTALGKFSTFTFDSACEQVLGKTGKQLYDEWKDFLSEHYNQRIKSVRENSVIGDTIGAVGFGNFYPVFSKDGKKILYISNKSSDYFSPSGLFLYDIETKSDKLIKMGVRSTFSWIDNETKVIYSKITDNNPNWYNVHDLYVYDIKNEKETRLTKNLRANQPSVSNDETKIVFLFQKDGTTNLALVNIDGSDYKQLTFFENGEQVYNPKFSPDDAHIIFDYSYHNTRDIARISAGGGKVEFVIATDNDERNPSFDKDGNLIFASDETGIYNIYKLNLLSGEKKQLTNVTGGAFMSSVNSSGDIVYAGYTSEGYKIFYLENSNQEVKAGASYVKVDNPPLGKDLPNGDINNFDIVSLRDFNDYELPEYDKKPYTGAFSRLTFFPFIRLDNYNTSNKFLEKLKPGLFVSSNDMLNRYAIFAGGAINSRLERDLFLIFEYKNKLPLLTSLGLRPELALEVYSITRKAGNNLLLGEYYDSLGQQQFDFNIPVDVTYSLFEVDFIIKHRLFSRNQNLQTKFVYSTYEALIGSFLVNDKLSSKFKDNYFIGRNIELKYTWDSFLPSKDVVINPVGFALDLTYNFEFNKYNEENDYDIEEGILKPIFKNFNFHRLELNSRLHLPTFKSHTVTATIRAGSILGPEVPDFFDFYLGGLLGMKAYPFYAVSGNEIAWLNLTYRFPLFRNIDAKFGHLYLDKIFLSFHGDIGNAWTGDIPSFDTFKKGAGAELRFQLNSYYLFPTSVFFNASYGFDTFERNIRGESVKYGKEWRFYAGVLFDFEILNAGKHFRAR